MPSRLKRVSEPTETTITALAAREGRTFVAQLDRVVTAGLQALGEPPLTDDTPTTTASTRSRARG